MADFHCVYVIRCPSINKFYVGSKTSKKHPSKVILKSYWTSSKVVKRIVETHGPKSFELVSIKMCETSYDSIVLEDRILRNIKCRDKFLNLNFSAGIGAVHKKRTNVMITSGDGEYQAWPKFTHLPEGFWIEYPHRPPPRKGYRCFTDGQETVWIPPGESPPKRMIGVTEYNQWMKAKDSKGKVGLRYYNNGVDQRKYHPGHQPKDWVPGTIKRPKRKTKPRTTPSSRTGKVCINNGVKNAFIDSKEIVPDGWYVGSYRKPGRVIRCIQVTVDGVQYSSMVEAGLVLNINPSAFTVYTKKYKTTNINTKNGRLIAPK